MNNSFKIMWCDLTPAAQDRIFDSLNINLKLCFNAEEVETSYQDIKRESIKNKYIKVDSSPAVKTTKKRTYKRRKFDDDRVLKMKDFIKENDKVFGGKMSVRDITTTLGISIGKYYKLKNEAVDEIKGAGICDIS